jgi:hypothetical protein
VVDLFNDDNEPDALEVDDDLGDDGTEPVSPEPDEPDVDSDDDLDEDDDVVEEDETM